MVRTGADGGYGGAVRSRGVALVHGPAVVGEFDIELGHDGITSGLGHNRSRCYVGILCVALDHCGVANIFEGLEAVAVDDDGAGALTEGAQGAVHSLDGGVQYVHLVDFLGRANTYGPGHSVAHDDLAHFVAAMLTQLLRVDKPRMRIAVGQNYSGRDDRAGQAAAAGFVAPGLEASRFEARGQRWCSRFTQWFAY